MSLSRRVLFERFHCIHISIDSKLFTFAYVTELLFQGLRMPCGFNLIEQSFLPDFQG